jgi:glycosyltransferase involved in cell wall biosynthesis
LQVLFVGALRPFKGPVLLLRAAAQFPAVDFTIVGEGVLAGELEDQVRAQGLTNVQFARGLNHAKLRERYRQADIFLFPSRWEGSPKVIMEAAACGLPVIARGDYQPETVVHGVTGLLGASDDELLSFLAQLIEREELRMKFGHAARAHIERFDWDRIVPMWEEAFEKLSSQRRSHKPA